MIVKDFNNGWTFIKDKEESRIDLPHDAMIHEGREENGLTGVGGAYFKGGFYTYKKSFMVPKEFQQNSIFLHVLGAYRNSKVYLNDNLLAENQYGYIDYSVELKGLLYGLSNTITITIDNTKVPNSRWYSGAGLYRGVELIIGGANHFIVNEIRLKTISLNPVVLSYNLPHTGLDRDKVEIEVFDGNKCISKGDGVKGLLTFDAAPWDTLNPKMYKINLTLSRDNDIIDTYTIPYGFRTLEYTNKGFFLNGVKTILKGACLHHDNGILGSVSIYDAEVKRLKILKDAGFNAIRSAHNPASPILLKACDDLGILVMDELCDMWLYHKTEYDYADDFKKNYMKDLKSMMDKDYNHPSVIMYSLGNELASPTTLNPEGFKILEELCDYIHKNDYRPSTMGVNFTNLEREELNAHKARYKMMEVYTNSDEIVKDYNDIIVKFGEGMSLISTAKDSEEVSVDTFKVLDLAGYNYAYGRYELDSKIHPERIIVGTETMCRDIYNNYERMKKYPAVIGDFIWTGIDYLGEVGIGGYFDYDHHFCKPYPWILANGGAFDLLGYPTGEAFLAGITYGKYKLKIATYLYDKEETKSAWRWTNSRQTYTYPKDKIGKDIVAEVYSIYPYVELFLNGKSLGRKEVINGYTTFNFKYEVGTLKAVATSLDDRRDVCILKTSKSSNLTLRKDYEGKDLVYVYVEYKDLNGTIDTTKSDLLNLKVEGGTLLGFGSANPKTEDDYTKGSCHAFLGSAMLCVKKESKEIIVSVQDNNEIKTIKI